MPHKFKRILNEVLNHIADFYFYFFVFYVFSLVLSLFFESWKLFFYWAAFHISIIVFGALSLTSEKGKEFVKSIVYKIKKFKIPSYSPAKILKENLGGQKFQIIPKLEIQKIKIPKFDFSKLFSVFFELKNLIPKFFDLAIKFYESIRTAGVILKIIFIFLIGFLIGLFQIPIFFVYGQIQKLTRNDFIKITIMAAILGFALYKGIDIINFLILVYGLASVLFVMEGRISAAIALAFLILTPIFLIIGNSISAEKMAVFAYYFLVIAIFTQIREYSRENSKQGLSTKF